MKPLWMCRHARAEERITKPICGSTAAREEPKQFLGQFEGILQTDGYAAYDPIGGTRMVHAACWAHARRQFFEAVQLNHRDPVATSIVARMDELFAVEAEARSRVLSVAG